VEPRNEKLRIAGGVIRLRDCGGISRPSYVLAVLPLLTKGALENREWRLRLGDGPVLSKQLVVIGLFFLVASMGIGSAAAQEVGVLLSKVSAFARTEVVIANRIFCGRCPRTGLVSGSSFRQMSAYRLNRPRRRQPVRAGWIGHIEVLNRSVEVMSGNLPPGIKIARDLMAGCGSGGTASRSVSDFLTLKFMDVRCGGLTGETVLNLEFTTRGSSVSRLME